MKTPTKKTRIAFVVPHIFMHRDILANVIFSPGHLALQLIEGMAEYDIEVTLYCPGPADTDLPQVNADLSYFEKELEGRGDTYVELLKKHPFTFVTLSRQVQAEVISKAFAAANAGYHDLVHVYTNEEDIALPFAALCRRPVVFTHHDPFNFMVRYKNIFPKYKDLNWLSISYAQRESMPDDTNWVGNIYHGIDPVEFEPTKKPKAHYIAYLGRIIEPKGVHLAIQAVREYNKTAETPLELHIAGKHYSEDKNDNYWQTMIEPELDDTIRYAGFIKDTAEKNSFLANAKALVVPSLFSEPFGMVMIEALASGTPLIGLDSGAIPEIINDDNGILVTQSDNTVADLAKAFGDISRVNRKDCRADYESRFTLERMRAEHVDVYQQLIES